LGRSKDAPDDKAVYAAEATMRQGIEGLVAASINDPTVGPALLTGRRRGGVFSTKSLAIAPKPPSKRRERGTTFRKK